MMMMIMMEGQFSNDCMQSDSFPMLMMMMMEGQFSNYDVEGQFSNDDDDDDDGGTTAFQ